jgi:outer membrane protein
MHKRTPALAFGIALALLAANAWSANLLEVYQAAAKSDPTILEAQARRMAALEVKPQALGLLFPQISATGQAARDNLSGSTTFPQVNPLTQEIVNVNNSQQRDSDNWRYQAQLTQTVFDWNQWQTLQRADSEVALAEANYRAAEQDLLVRVAGRYFDVLAAKDTLDAAEATLQAVTRQLEQAEKRFEVGLIAITDVQEARAAHDNATAGVILAKRSLATANEYLRELTGEEYQELVKPADDMPLDQPEPGDQDSWVTRAETQNMNVIAARLGVDIAKTNVKIAESGHLPTVQLFANYGQYSSSATQTNKLTGGSPVTGPADASQTEDTYGVQVTLPIFSGGVTQSKCASRCTCTAPRARNWRERCAAPSARRATPGSASLRRKHASRHSSRRSHPTRPRSRRPRRDSKSARARRWTYSMRGSTCSKPSATMRAAATTTWSTSYT